MLLHTRSQGRHHIVVIGGGFAGLNLVRKLKREPVDVTLLDKRNFHLFQPLLYQVATGSLSPADICAPLRAILRKQRNVQVVMADAVDFDLDRNRVVTDRGDVEYDSLVLACGLGSNYFGHDEWADHAPGLKGLEDALRIRQRILQAFEEAELATDPDEVSRWLTFVVVGGGATGVELAGTLADMCHHTLKHDFRSIDPQQARIVLVEGGQNVLETYPGDLPARATEQLKDLGVEVMTGALAQEVGPDRVVCKSKDGAVTTLHAHTCLWGAGVGGLPLTQRFAEAVGVQPDRQGRIPVDARLRVGGDGTLLAVGDVAHAVGEDGKPYPGVAQNAIQQGRYAARQLAARAVGRDLDEPYRYWDLGSMATIGRSKAVADLHFVRLSGWLAWQMWLWVHLLNLVQFRSRLLVLIQWAYNYFSWDRSARLITEIDPEEAVIAGSSMAAVNAAAADRRRPVTRAESA